MGLLLLLLIKSNVSFAGFEYLWKFSDGTYVSTEHGGFFADTYYGTASVRGTDRTYNSQYGNRAYFLWTKITYDVQGDITSTTAYSGGPNNSSDVVKKITAKDKWNDEKKTIAYYDYDTKDLSQSKPGPIQSKVENSDNK